MAYQIRESGKSFEVVATANDGEIVGRVLNVYACRADAERLVSDLAGWGL